MSKPNYEPVKTPPGHWIFRGYNGNAFPEFPAIFLIAPDGECVMEAKSDSVPKDRALEILMLLNKSERKP